MGQSPGRVCKRPKRVSFFASLHPRRDGADGWARDANATCDATARVTLYRNNNTHARTQQYYHYYYYEDDDDDERDARDGYDAPTRSRG